MSLENLILELHEGKCNLDTIEFADLTQVQLNKLLLALNNRNLPHLTKISITALEACDAEEVIKKPLHVFTLNCHNLSILELQMKVCIDSVDISKCINLEKIDLSYSEFRHISLPYYAIFLETLNLSNSQIKYINLMDYPLLKHFEAQNTPLEEIYVKNHSSLSTIDLRNTVKLQHAKFDCTVLKKLNLKNTNLVGLDLSRCKELEELNISGSQINNLGTISSCQELNTLHLSKSAIRIIPAFSANKKLKLVTMQNLELSKFAVLVLQNVILSKLTDQEIKFIHNQTFNTLDLSCDEFNDAINSHFACELDLLSTLEHKDPHDWSSEDKHLLGKLLLEISTQCPEIVTALSSTKFAEEISTFQNKINQRATQLRIQIDRCKYWLELPDIYRNGVQIPFDNIEIDDLKDTSALIYDRLNNEQICNFLSKINGVLLPLETIDLRTFEPSTDQQNTKGVNLNLNCPKLSTFKIDTPCISLLDVANCEQLVELCLQNLKISILPDLSNCSKLQNIDVSGCSFSDLGIFALHKLRNVRTKINFIVGKFLQDALDHLDFCSSTEDSYTDLLIEAINSFQNCHIYLIRNLEPEKISEYQKLYKLQCNQLLKLFSMDRHEKYFSELETNLESAVKKRTNKQEAITQLDFKKNSAKIYSIPVP